MNLTKERKERIENEYEDGTEKVRYLSTVERVAGADVLPSDIDEFLRTEDLSIHRELAEFWVTIDAEGGFKEGLQALRERQGIERASGPTDTVRQVERANANVDPDPEGDDASIVEAVKLDPSAAVRATDDQLMQAISELWSDGRRTDARRLMFANAHRFDDDARQNALGGEDVDRSITANASRERWDAENPQSPDTAERRRENAKDGDESSPGVTSTLETMPGSVQDHAAEERTREAIEQNKARGNATDGDDVDMSLSPQSAVERFEDRQNARYESESGGD